MASLPSEILFQIFRNFNDSDPTIRQFLLTARLTSRQLNDVISDIFLRSWTFSLGTSLESTVLRCSKISNSTFNSNITGLKFATVSIIPEPLASKTSERDWWVQAPFWTPSNLTTRFSESATSNFEKLTEAALGLIRVIGPNIKSLSFEIDFIGDAITPYFSTFIANLLAVADSEGCLGNVQTLEIRLLDTGHLTSLPAGPIVSNAVPDRDSGLLLRSHPLGWKLNEGIDRDIYLDWRRNRDNVPKIFNRIKNLSITLLHGKSTIFEHETRGIESIEQMAEFMYHFDVLESISFDVDGGFIYVPVGRYFNVENLKRFRICNARLNIALLLRDLGLLQSQQERFGGVLECLEIEDVVFTAEGGEAVSRNDIDTMESLYGRILAILPGLTTLRLGNVRNLEPIEVGTIERQCLTFRLPVEPKIEHCPWNFKRVLYTRREEDITAFINLRDALIRRREEKEIKRDPWLQFCVEYEKDVAVLMD